MPRVLYVHADTAALGVPFSVLELAPGEEVTERLPGVARGSRGPRSASPTISSRRCARCTRSTGARRRCASSRATTATSSGSCDASASCSLQTRTRPLPLADELAERLEQLRPDQRETTLVHGDFRLGNVLALPGPVRISALLDWELATLGDPLADLGYLAATWSEPGSRGNALELRPSPARPGSPRAASSSRATPSGRAASSTDLPWYMALALWKGAIFLEGNYRRLLAGSTDDPYYRGLDAGVPELLEEAWELVR